MCHGSKKMNEATNQSMYVDASEMMTVRKTSSLNMSVQSKVLVSTFCSIDLTVINIEAKAK